MRPIDSEAAYQFLTDQLVKETGAFSKGVNKGLNIARSAMRNPDAIPTITPQNEWVSVEEHLPPPNVRVLAYRPGEEDNSPYKYTNMWGWAVKESIRHKGITHWMYYPEPPDRRPPERQED